MNQKYTLYIVNVVNDYSRWKGLVFNEISTRCIEAHFQQLSLQCSNGTLCLLIALEDYWMIRKPLKTLVQLC